MNTVTPVVKYLLGINIFVFFAQIILKIDLHEAFALRYFNSEFFKVYQLITYMFLHGDTQHLLFNMFALFSFGPILETLWGSRQFLIFYLVVGVGASLFHMLFTYYDLSKVYAAMQTFIDYPSKATLLNFEAKFPLFEISRNNFKVYELIESNKNLQAQIVETMNSYISAIQNVPMVGASGAISGLLMAFVYYFPKTDMTIMFIPIPIKAWILITFYIIYELYMGIKNNVGDNVAHFAHLGGFLVGFIMLKFIKIQRRPF